MKRKEQKKEDRYLIVNVLGKLLVLLSINDYLILLFISAKRVFIFIGL